MQACFLVSSRLSLEPPPPPVLPHRLVRWQRCGPPWHAQLARQLVLERGLYTRRPNVQAVSVSCPGAAGTDAGRAGGTVHGPSNAHGPTYSREERLSPPGIVFFGGSRLSHHATLPSKAEGLGGKEQLLWAHQGGAGPAVAWTCSMHTCSGVAAV